MNTTGTSVQVSTQHDLKILRRTFILAEEPDPLFIHIGNRDPNLGQCPQTDGFTLVDPVEYLDRRTGTILIRGPQQPFLVVIECDEDMDVLGSG